VKRDEKNQESSTDPLSEKGFSKKRIFLLIFIIFVSSNIVFYIKERIHWVSAEHAHIDAKEYFVLNNMVFFYRKMLNIFIEVDHPFMQPLNKLQENLYHKGVKHLPKDDAEIAIWRYKFFLYFYVRKNYMPKVYLANPKDVSKKRTDVLDEAYWIMETLAIKNIADFEMNQEIKYKIFPLIASFYALKHGNYFGSKAAFYRTKALMQSPVHMQRIERLIDWLITFKKGWDRDRVLQQGHL
jgi:hypothetical protein